MSSIFGEGYQQRKNIPLFHFLIRYFPRALVQVTKVCVAGNVQHNPELAPTDINWSRNKSTDQLNTALRHMVDHAMGHIYEDEPPGVLEAIDQPEGTYTLAKAAWRILAELELQIEADEKRKAENAEWWAKANQNSIEPPKPLGWEFECVDLAAADAGFTPREPFHSHVIDASDLRCIYCRLKQNERGPEEERQKSFAAYINAHGSLP
jgi:Domain of unknown function (DUF5664)